MPVKALVLCTGNSARSQMAEGFLRSFDKRLEVHSAGTAPAARVNPFAVRAMAEAGIDISEGIPKNVDRFLGEPFDFVFTVCGNADQTCPGFTGTVGRRVHIGFDDPAAAAGTDDEVMAEFRRVRDEIRRQFSKFYEQEIRRLL